MPQMFQVLRCYKCSVFQVHQTKKSNKWQCKLCGEKQSMKRYYDLGTAKDCRLHVQKLNGIRGEIDELAESSQNDTDAEIECDDPPITVIEKPPKKSKWSDYVDDLESNENKTEDEIMYLGNTEVVLDLNKRKRKLKSNSFKVPKKNTNYEEEKSETQRDNNGWKENFQTLSHKSNQDSFIAENYHTTTNYYNSTALKKRVNNNDSFKVRTDIPLAVNNPKLEAQGSKTQASFIPPVVNKNSRWAQYVETEESSEEENNELLKSHNISRNSNKQTQSIFSLCDDRDLDDVLDI